jgi:hypothetical protein
MASAGHEVIIYGKAVHVPPRGQPWYAEPNSQNAVAQTDTFPSFFRQMMAASVRPSSDEKSAESSLALKTSTLSPDISAERVSLFFLIHLYMFYGTMPIGRVGLPKFIRMDDNRSTKLRRRMLLQFQKISLITSPQSHGARVCASPDPSSGIL